MTAATKIDSAAAALTFAAKGPGLRVDLDHLILIPANCQTFANIAIKREKERDAIDARLCEFNSNLQDAQRERDKWKKRSEEDLDAVDALRKALEDARDGLEEYAAAFEWKANPIRDRIVAALGAEKERKG